MSFTCFLPGVVRFGKKLDIVLYKTVSRFLPNITTPGKHHTERKQNQNRKRVRKKKEQQHFFILCHHAFGNPFCFF